MSSLIFYTDAAQALVATDTLAVSNNGEPFKFTTKAILVPHLHLVLCVTGAHGMLGRWFVQVNDWTEVRDLDHLNYHTPNQLNSLWREYHDEIAVPEGATVTIYHIGFSLEARVIHAYAYRSTNQFRSELLPYGLAVKPECPVLDHYELPTDIRRMMDTQRTIEAVRPPHERVYIGGEIQIHHLTMDGCSIYSLGRFEDYEQHEQSMYENLRPNPQNRLGSRAGVSDGSDGGKGAAALDGHVGSLGNVHHLHAWKASCPNTIPFWRARAGNASPEAAIQPSRQGPRPPAGSPLRGLA